MSVIETTKPPEPRLGEELPLFCEKCGYSLNGLPMTRCEACQILHFACPECGHHQPINTVRPAIQKTLARLQAVGLGFAVLFKLCLLIGAMIGWFAMAVEWQREAWQLFSSDPVIGVQHDATAVEVIGIFALAAMMYAGFGRLLLLQFRRTWLVGMVLGLLAAGAIFLGWQFQAFMVPRRMLIVLHTGMFCIMAITVVFSVVGATCVWPIWQSLVGLLLPKSSADAILKWQAEQLGSNK